MGKNLARSLIPVRAIDRSFDGECVSIGSVFAKGGFNRKKFNGDDTVLSYLITKGESHETYNISVGSRLGIGKYVRAGAIPRPWRVWIGRAAVRGLLLSSGRFDKRGSNLAEHWPGSPDAQRSHDG
jgi:hypothetical protein